MALFSTQISHTAFETSGILIVRLSAHGDVVQTLPLLQAIKTHYPTVRIGWVVEASAAPLLENHPLIDTLIISHRKRWLGNVLKPWRWLATLGEVRAFIQQIRQERYEISLDVQGLLKSALIPWMAGIPTRIGYERTRENASLFYTRLVAHHQMDEPNLHAARVFLRLAEPLKDLLHTEAGPGAAGVVAQTESLHYPLAPVPVKNHHKVAGWLSGIPSQYFKLVLAPGTIWPSKHWPVSHWQTLLSMLYPLPVAIVWVGGSNEKTLVQHIQTTTAPMPAHQIDLTGETTWAELQALLGQVDGLLGLDSAPLHLANAVADVTVNPPQPLDIPESKSATPRSGTPMILGLYGPTSPGRTGPTVGHFITFPTLRGEAPVSFSLLCQPCFKRACPLSDPTAHHACMREITPESVLAVVQQWLSHSARPAMEAQPEEQLH